MISLLSDEEHSQKWNRSIWHGIAIGIVITMMIITQVVVRADGEKKILKKDQVQQVAIHKLAYKLA